MKKVGLFVLSALFIASAPGDSPAATLAEAKGGMADPGGLRAECLAPKPLSQPVTLKYGLSAMVELYAAPFLADAMGELAAENLKISPTLLQSAESIQAVGSGDLDVVYASTAQPFLNVVAGKVNVRVALPGVIATEDSAGFFARKDMFPDAANPDIRLLKGKVVSFPGGVNSFSAFAMSETLAKGGLTVDDLQVVNIGTADMFQSMETGAVQASVLFPPYIERAKATNKYVRLGGLPDRYPIASYYFGPNLLEKNREAGLAFVRAILRTQIKYLGRDYRKNPEVVNALAKIMKTEPASVRVGDPIVHSYRFDEKMFEPLQTFYLGRPGQLRYKTPLPFSDLADVDFVKTATASCPK